MAIKKIKVSGTSYDINDPRIAGIDNTPTDSSNNLVTSGGVKNYIDFVNITSVNESEYTPANGHEYVDLGLRSGGNKILFATMNIGASAPQEYGDYFAWAETSKRYSGISNNIIQDGTFELSNAPYRNNDTWTKYIYVIDDSTLSVTDDVASEQWGGKWRMPNESDLQFLLNSSYCTKEWVSDYNSTGVAGLVITGKGDYINSIFLPAAGMCDNNERTTLNVSSCYWSRNRSSSEISNAVKLTFYYYNGSVGASIGDFQRYKGCSVRPVLVIPE